MKIKAKNPKAVAGIRLIVPVDGLIIIDGEGCVEVSAACAEALVNGTADWDYAEKREEEAPEAPADEEPAGEEETSAELTEREEFASKLESMTVAQMKDLCLEGGFPEEEWKSLKKATLAAYLLDKFDSADVEEEEEEPIEEEEK